MPTDVEKQIALLEKIQRITSNTYIGVSDRKRAIFEIERLILHHNFDVANTALHSKING